MDAMLLMMAALLAMMWFTTSRQRKAQRERQAFRDNLTAGAHVVTTSGLHGTLLAADPGSETVVLDAGAGPMTWSRDAIGKELDTPFVPVALAAATQYGAPMGATISSQHIDEEVAMPEFQQEPEIEVSPWVEDIDYVEGNEHLEAPPLRRRESLAEAAAEGPLDWPDDGSRAKHQGYVDRDGEWELRHDAPVEERRDGDGDNISLAIAEEMAQRGGMP